MYYTQEQIDRANQADLVSFLQSQGEQLTRAGNEYRWKRHDSLTVRGNKWYRHSQSKGGGPVDFVMEFFGKSFTEAVELLTGEKGAVPPPDRPCPASLSDFRLPPPNSDNRTARNYLTAARRIDEDVTGIFFARGDIYEDAAHHSAVFVGRDEDGIPRYAHSKGTAGNFRLDVKGSDKAFNFCYRGEGDRLFVFEAPVDLLSSSACSKRRGRSRAICHWAAWEKKPCCVSSLTAQTSRPFTSALTATKRETTLAAALRSLCRRDIPSTALCRCLRTGTRYCSTGQKSQTGSISGKRFTA